MNDIFKTFCMKNRYIYIVLLLIATIACSCGPDPDAGPISEPKRGIYVMKLTRPEYRDLVLARRESSYFVRAGRTISKEPIGKSGYSPYWELPNNWLLIDWKWEYGFLPYWDYTVLKKQTWKDLQNSPQKWLLTEPHTKENPIEKNIVIGLYNLENYSNAHYGSEMTNIILRNVPDELMCEMPEKMDSIWTILQAELSVAIEKGELEKINDIQYNPATDGRLH